MTVRADALAKAKARWATCDACPLAAGRRNVVVGELYLGAADVDVDNDPLLLVVGDAPGQNDDAAGRPFFGPAGEILRSDLLQAAGVQLALVTTLAACRTPSNRDPTAPECEACRPRLAQVVQTVRPVAVLTVGKLADQQLRGGLPHLGGDLLAGLPRANVVHPSQLLRQGHPSTATTKLLRTSLVKLRHLLQRAGMASLQVTTERVPGSPEVVDPATCSHVPARVGSWQASDGTAGPEIWACKRCGTFVEA